MTIWAEDAWAAEIVASAPAASSLPGLPGATFDPRMGGALVWVAEIEAALDGGTAALAGPSWAEAPWGSEPLAFLPAGGADTIRVNDLGWRGAQPYPPLLLGGPDIERRVALSPGQNDTYAWGSLRLASLDLVPGITLAGRDTALRRVRIRTGIQGWDSARGIPTDPQVANMIDAFLGLALTWRARDDGAEIPLRDPGAWLEAPIGRRKFLGTGGAEGPADLAGKAWPLVRGGSVGAPVRNCPVVLVDAATRLYRWSDLGRVVQIYEDGAPVYTNAGLVADCAAAGAPGAGAFCHDVLGQIRLGSDPAGAVTVDGYAGAIAAATVLRNLLMETVALPAGLLDEGSVLATAGAVPWAGGWAWTGDETARDATRPLLAALGARLVASRSGGLRLWPLRALTATARPVAAYDPRSALAMTPVALDAPLAPPAAAWAVGYARTHVITATPKPTVTAAERERLAQPWRSAAWADATNLTRYAQASRPALVETALLQAVEAQGLADALGALWGVPRSLWQVTLPVGAAVQRDMGDVVRLQWPADGLRDGALGQVVGESLRASEGTSALLVLV